MTSKQSNDVLLEDILNTTPIAVGWSHISTGRIEYINKSFIQLFGYTLEDIPDIKTGCSLTFSDVNFYENIIQPWILNNKGDVSEEALKTPLLCKDGSLKQVSINFATVGEKRLWYFDDITEHWVAEKRLRARSDMLELVSNSSALKDILDVIVKEIQQEKPDSFCSILLYDKDAQCLRLGAAPSLPDFYNEAVDGVRPGMNVGSCGTSAHIKQRVIVADIAADERWTCFAELADKANLASCWSDPIMSSKGELLGTFAIYNSSPSKPSEKDFELILFASNLASIAIESFRAQEELEQRAYYDHLTGLCNRGHFFEQCTDVMSNTILHDSPLSIVMLDLDNFKHINDDYGHKTGDLVLQKLAEISQFVLGDDDIIARIGGEEFAILLPFKGEEQAILIAEKLRKAIEQSMVLSAENQKVFFTASLGVAYKEHGHCSVDELLSCADKALYQSKSSGKNCVSSKGCIGKSSLF